MLVQQAHFQRLSAWIIQLIIIMPSGLLMLTSGFAVLKELQKMAQVRTQKQALFCALFFVLFFTFECVF